MPNPSEIHFDVHFAGEKDAGLWPFNDTISISCESGDWGGAPGEFKNLLREFLADWYDGATVVVSTTQQEEI